MSDNPLFFSTLKFRGSNLDFIKAHEHEVIISSPSDCVGADTLIETADGKIPIGKLYSSGVAPVVFTAFGPRQASVPFLKGRAELFELFLSNGESITCTSGHWLLGAGGFFSALHFESGVLPLLPSAAFHPQSILEHGRTIPISDVHRCLKKAPSSESDYPAYFYSYGEPPLRQGEACQCAFLQQGDVQARSSCGVCSDGLESRYERTHLCQPSFHRAISSCQHHEKLSGTIRESRFFSEICECQSGLSRFFFESMSKLPPGSPFSGSISGFCPERFLSSYISENIQLIRVVSIRNVGVGNFYDLRVPDADHYFAHGVVHHNTGKTVAACYKAIMIALFKPNIHAAIVRRTYNSLHESVLKTFERVGAGLGIRSYGGERVEKYMFPNGSEIVPIGMDKPDRLLSSEWDFIQVCQSEELSEAQWEIASSRCTGRGATVKYPQIFGDCNPSTRLHWIRTRKALRLIVGSHRDNPELYDDIGIVTEVGQARIAALEATLSGVRRKRLLDGIWATAEGAVFDMFDPQKHVVAWDFAKWGSFKRFFLAIDEGYTNPAVVLVIGEDADKRWHVLREFHKSGVLPEQHVSVAKAWFAEFHCEFAAVDESAAGLIASLKAVGVNARGGKGRVQDGIAIIQNRLAIQGDGRPRLTIDPSCVNSQNEFESYSWEPDKPKDTPVKENDHCFTAETLVLTKRGWVPIALILSGEYVWCPLGWNRVYASVCCGVKLVRDFGRFRATPDHKILTDSGLKRLDALRYFDKVLAWREPRSWSLTELFTGVTRSQKPQVRGIIIKALLVKSRQAAADVCIEQFGNTIMARCLKIWKYITRTAILSTIALVIWRLSRIWNMPAGTNGEAHLNAWLESGRWPQHGTGQRRDSNCIVPMAEKSGSTKSGLKNPVRCVENPTVHPFLIEASSAGLTAKCGGCGSGEIQTSSPMNPAGTETLALTYNLRTEYGCFFAGGVLVANSPDAMRYLADVLAESTGAVTAETAGGMETGTKTMFQPRPWTPRQWKIVG